VSPDGKRFIIVENDTSDESRPTPVTFVLNFFGRLRRLSSTTREESVLWLQCRNPCNRTASLEVSSLCEMSVNLRRPNASPPHKFPIVNNR